MPTAMKLVRAVSSIRVYIVLPFPNLPQPAQGDAVSLTENDRNDSNITV